MFARRMEVSLSRQKARTRVLTPCCCVGRTVILKPWARRPDPSRLAKHDRYPGCCTRGTRLATQECLTRLRSPRLAPTASLLTPSSVTALDCWLSVSYTLLLREPALRSSSFRRSFRCGGVAFVLPNALASRHLPNTSIYKSVLMRLWMPEERSQEQFREEEVGESFVRRWCKPFEDGFY